MNVKQRGLKRKCHNMVRRIEEETEVFPTRPLDCDYWHLHLPVAQSLVDSRATPFKIRRLCIATLIQRVYHLAHVSPAELQTRVVALITLPELWDSQIVVFFGEDHFRDFFDRERDGQKWTPTEIQLSKQWNLELPPGFRERVYYEECRDEDGVKHGQIWAIGDLKM